mmetsp:Transcript_8192/g.21763  ORF Transcript_8192/g.21763 Transcript_8192/m.21763 type:complete len:311 (+) Transcript_8192:492-1424(+)
MLLISSVARPAGAVLANMSSAARPMPMLTSFALSRSPARDRTGRERSTPPAGEKGTIALLLLLPILPLLAVLSSMVRESDSCSATLLTVRGGLWEEEGRSLPLMIPSPSEAPPPTLRVTVALTSLTVDSNSVAFLIPTAVADARMSRRRVASPASLSLFSLATCAMPMTLPVVGEKRAMATVCPPFTATSTSGLKRGWLCIFAGVVAVSKSPPASSPATHFDTATSIMRTDASPPLAPLLSDMKRREVEVESTANTRAADTCSSSLIAASALCSTLSRGPRVVRGRTSLKRSEESLSRTEVIDPPPSLSM